MKCSLSRAAEQELVEGARFYALRANVAVGRAFIAEFERAIGLLSSQPMLGSPWRAGTRRLPLRRFSYSIVYELRPLELRVIALAHQRRKPNYWIDRSSV